MNASIERKRIVKMYKCCNCDEVFYEPDEKHTTYESYYGVSSEFPNSTSLTLYVCPYCGYDELKEIEEDEDE